MGGADSYNLRGLSLLVAILSSFALVAVAGPMPAQASISRGAFEDCLIDEANAARSAAGIAELEMADDAGPLVRDWSEWMRFNEFTHMPQSLREDILPASWTTYGENIAMHSNDAMADCTSIHDMWMGSPGHRANILNPDFQFVAIGTYVDGSGWWATQLFFDATGYYVSCVGTFCDDDGSVFEDSIELMAGTGISTGCNPPTNNRFCPEDYVTRGEMAAFLVRALDLSAGSAPGFVDDDGSVFETDIERIAAAGITNGCNPPANTRFCPNRYVTRGQMAAFLVRAFQLPMVSNGDFADDDGSKFEDSIGSLAAAGITHGCNPPANTRFCSNDYVTRGQMAAFLARALGF